MSEGGWDLSDFVNKYTSKSHQIQQSSPLKASDFINDSMTSDPSPSKMERLETTVEGEDAFCTLENLQDRLNFLNQELSMHGFQPLFRGRHSASHHNHTVEDLDLTKLVTCTYELLRRQHQQAKVKEDLEERHLRSENDNEYLLQNQVRLKQDLENLKRESSLLLYREKEQIEKCRILSQDVKMEREEKRKLKSDVEHLKKQFYHESKRTEKEISRLKEKVHQLLNDKTMERKFGIDVLNALQRADGKRSTWKTAGKKNEEEMYKLIITNYEDKEKNLLTENQALRETINEVQNLLFCFNTSMTSEMAEEENKQLQMPYFMIKNDVENKFHTVISQIRDRLENAPSKESSPIKVDDTSLNSTKPALDDLQNKLELCKSVISGQEAIIQGLKEGYSKEAFERALLTFGISEENYEESEKRMNKLRNDERKFNEERKNFTDYVLKISKEREEFEKERVEFYMQCISTPVINRDKKLHPRGNSKHTLRMATPSFSPAPASMTQRKKDNKLSSKTPPSTAELYRYMSLNYDGTASRNLNGSFVEASISSDGSPSPKKLHEHAENIRRAVEERHNKSLEGNEAKSFPSNNPLYVME